MTQACVPSHCLTPHRRPAFTLVELMISIALALLLVLGINAVFKMSSDTVGTGMQISEITRQFRTARTVMDNDFSYFVGYQQQPALIITSYNQPAFRDRKDELAAQAAAGTNVIVGPYDPTTTNLDTVQSQVLDARDADGNSVYGVRNAMVTPNLYLPQIVNNRNHRVDMLGFCVKNPGQFPRQTPNYGQTQMSAQTAEYAGTYKSADAWVVYGHLLQPSADVNATNMLQFSTDPTATGGQTHFLGLGVNTDPFTLSTYVSPSNAGTSGTLANPNNFYSSSWILGRTATLLGDPTQLANFTRTDLNGAAIADPQSYLQDPSYALYATSVAGGGGGLTTIQQAQVALRPVSWGSNMNLQVFNPAATFVKSQTSQQDVAGTTLIQFRENVLNAANPYVGTYMPRWFHPLLSMGVSKYEAGTGPLVSQYPPGMTSPTWPVDTTNATIATSQARQPWHMNRAMGQAWPDKLGASAAAGALTPTTPPYMHEQLAVQSPVFLRGCSSFVVEYAGDYLKQNVVASAGTVGAITGIGEDGQIDFDVITDPSGAVTTPMKRIRWYGMTRSLDDGVTVENLATPMVTTPLATAGAPPANSEIVRPLYRYIQQYTSLSPANAQGMATIAAVRYLPFEKPFDKTANVYEGLPDNKNRPINLDSYTCAWSPTDMDLDLMQAPVAGTADPSLVQLWSVLQKNGAYSAFPSRSLLPWMIRVTIRLDDPNGRLPDGQTMQFIYNVPRPHP